MIFETHKASALNVEDDAVPVIEGWLNGRLAGLRRQPEEFGPVELVEPGQARRPCCIVSACTRPRKICVTWSASRDKIGVRGNSRNSAWAATAAMSCCQSEGRKLATLNVVQENQRHGFSTCRCKTPC